MLERFFKLKENNTTVRTEVIAGLTTFMTMAYIIFANPDILSAAGIPKTAAIVGTCLAAALTTAFMGIYTNYPFALAAGMGLNAFLAFGVVLGMKVSPATAMGVVVIEGVLVTLLVLTNLREAVMNAIPLTMKRAIGVGIGLFIALIGLVDAKFIAASPATLITYADIKNPRLWVTIFGLLLTAVLMARKVKGSMLIGILCSTIFAIVLGVTKLPSGIFSFPTASDFSTIGAFDLKALTNVGLWSVIFSFLITDFFDTMGTVVAIGGEGGYLDEKGQLPRLKKVLFADSIAAIIGGLFGISSNTTYVEGASGVAEGGRTGLTSVVTALCFAVAIFFVPVIGIVPTEAVAPALIIVGFLMLTGVKEIPFDNFEEAFPAFITMISIPFNYSIARGIGYGFISYIVIKLFSGKAKDIHPLMYLVSVAFIASFLL